MEDLTEVSHESTSSQGFWHGTEASVWVIHGRERPIPRQGHGCQTPLSLGTFDTADEAEAALLIHHLTGDAEPVEPPPGDDTLLGGCLTGWVHRVLSVEEATGTLRSSTGRDYRQVVENHLLPGLGHVRIADLRPPELRRFLNSLREKGLSDRTVVKVFRTLRGALADAESHFNPAGRLPRKDRPRVHTAGRSSDPRWRR